jgi:hypothetical protein
MSSDLAGLFDKNHPFISEPGEWLTLGAGVSGTDLARFTLDGRTNVYHEDGRIRVEGFMSVIAYEGKNFVTGYTLEPTEHPNLLEYRQENPEVGGVRGELLWMDDRLVVTFASGDGTLNGNELFHKLGDNRYTVTGSVSREGSFVSVWKVDLVRKAADA